MSVILLGLQCANRWPSCVLISRAEIHASARYYQNINDHLRWTIFALSGATLHRLRRYPISHCWALASRVQWLTIHCPACRTSLIATRFWVVMICPIIKCLTVLEFVFILFDLCLFITIFNFILNYVPTVTFWIFTYHKIWILLIIFCFIWNYWIIYFLTCLEVFWSVVS